MAKIENKAELIEQLAKMLENFALDCKPYKRYVWLDVDEDGHGELDDSTEYDADTDHCDSYLVYVNPGYPEPLAFNCGGDMEWMCRELDITPEEVAEELDIHPEDLTYTDVCRYVSDDDDLCELLREVVQEDLSRKDLERQAEDIFDDWWELERWDERWNER